MKFRAALPVFIASAAIAFGAEPKPGLDETVRSELRAGVRDGADSAARIRSLWTLHSIGGLDERFGMENLKSSDEYVRAWTIQLLCEDKKASAALLKEFARLAREDESPVVRLYLAAAMQRLPVAERWDVLQALYAHSGDATDHNLPLMIWYAAEPLPTLDFVRALAMAEKTQLPNILNFTVRRTAALNTPEAFAAIAASLARVPDEKRQLDILNGFSVALKGQRSATMPRGWEAVETRLSSSANAEIRAQLQSLSLMFGSKQALASLRKTLLDERADATARRTALDSLLAAKDPGLAPLLRQVLRESSLQSAALRGLAAYDDTETPDAIIAIYDSLGTAAKRDALNTLVSRLAFARPLLAAVSSGAVPKQDLTAELVRQLRNLNNPELDAELQKVWGTLRESAADKQEEIARYRKIYRAGGSQPGDAVRGRVVYARACAQCHVLFDSGGHVGPDLTGSNRGDLDYILQNIIDPNAVIPNDYRTWNLETHDDRFISGILKQQDEKSVTLVTANETLTIPRDEIASLRESELSMMPEELLQTFTDQEVRDLIYYLRQPSQAPLIGTPETVALFFNGKDLSNWDGDTELWRVENGEIVGSTATGLKHNEFLKSQLVLEDFRFVFQVKLTPNKENSGVQFRSEPFGEYEMRGPQADIGAGWWGKLYEENGRKLLWSKPGDAHVKTNDWNTYEILAVGSKVRTAINGRLCVDLDDPQISRRGIIGLQLHSGGPMEVRFKDLELELNPEFELVTVQGGARAANPQ